MGTGDISPAGSAAAITGHCLPLAPEPEKAGSDRSENNRNCAPLYIIYPLFTCSKMIQILFS